MPTIDNKTQTLAGQLSSLQTRLGNQLPTKTWRDLRHNAHDRAFVVAGAMKADLLNDLANAVNDSISKGLGLDYFQKQFDSIVAKHGWTHTGERRWRAQVIYGTNMRVSYAAGRLAQLRDPELRALKPFWMYRHSGAEHPRLQHKAWDKLCLPADDPWFKTHYPPNGWGCGCTLQAVSARDIARLGGRIEKPPEGTDGIDEGWDYMPGADVVDELGAFAQQKAAALPAPLARSLDADVAPHSWTDQEWIDAGEKVMHGIAEGELHDHVVRVISQRGVAVLQNMQGTAAARRLVSAAAERFPAPWIGKTDALGTLHVKESKTRCFQFTAKKASGLKIGSRVQFFDAGEGYLTVRDLQVATHELAHRIQAALPQLDAFFQRLHQRRTTGDKLESLKKVTGINYGAHERTRKDGYLNAYFGKEYADGGALEMMTMTLEHVLHSQKTALDLFKHDRELFHLAMGLLRHWK